MAVWMCPGQGTQKTGMATDFFDIPQVAHVFEKTSQALEVDLKDLACNGSEDEINQAIPAQGLTFAASVGIGFALQAKGIMPTAYVGFSLGQISALALSGALAFDDALELLRVRTFAMDTACKSHPGGMTALMGASEETAAHVCTECAAGQVLVPANRNAPGQIVISGEIDALGRAERAWADAGKKCARLATAGAFHSPLMHDAAVEVEQLCKTLTFHQPSVSLICNTDAQPFDVAHAPERLKNQVQQGVLFEQSINALCERGETTFIEVGFGKVLCGLVRRINKEAERIPVGTRAQFDAFVEQ